MMNQNKRLLSNTPFCSIALKMLSVIVDRRVIVKYKLNEYFAKRAFTKHIKKKNIQNTF